MSWKGKSAGRFRSAFVALLPIACIPALVEGFQLPIAKGSRAYAILKGSHLVYLEPDSNRLTSSEFPSGRIRWQIPWPGLAENAMLSGDRYLLIRYLGEENWEFQNRSMLALADTHSVRFKDSAALHVRLIDSLSALVFEKNAVALIGLDSSARKARAQLPEIDFPFSDAMRSGDTVYCLVSFERIGVRLLRMEVSPDSIRLRLLPDGRGVSHYVENPLLSDRFTLEAGILYRARKTPKGLALSACPLARTCRLREIGIKREEGHFIGFSAGRPAFLTQADFRISFFGQDRESVDPEPPIRP